MPDEAEYVPREIVIAVLGSPSSGKTQLIQQFVECTFSEKYRPTSCLETYYNTVSLNERIYSLVIVDVPFLPNPKTNLIAQEWSGLKDANALIFLFDVTREESFVHLRKLYDQLRETPHVNGATPSSNGHANGNLSLPVGTPIIVVGNKYDLLVQGKGHLAKKYTEIVTVIQKTWKLPFVECSAKHNWQVQLAFKNLVKMLDSESYGHHKLVPRVLQQHKSRCAIC